MSTSKQVGDPGAALRKARQRLADAESAITAHGEAELERVRDALERADSLLDRYEDSATGTGDFQAYVEFQGAFADLAEDPPEDLPARDAFERANEVVDQRRLSASDFATARETLDPARELAALLAEREAAVEAVHEAERAVESRIADLEERIADRERVLELGEAFERAESDPTVDGDVDARVADLRETVVAYDEAVGDAFREFRRDASARELLRFVGDTAYFPFVPFETPPDELVDYLEGYAVGEESVPDLLAYADYSASKLDHYVEDPEPFKTHIPVHRTYLDRLSADPLTVGWPPPPAGELRVLAGELVSVVAKFAEESVVADARTVGRTAGRDDFDSLRRVAVAQSELGEAEREGLEAGEVEAELEAARTERKRHRDVLADSG